MGGWVGLGVGIYYVPKEQRAPEQEALGDAKHFVCVFVREGLFGPYPCFCVYGMERGGEWVDCWWIFLLLVVSVGCKRRKGRRRGASGCRASRAAHLPFLLVWGPPRTEEGKKGSTQRQAGGTKRGESTHSSSWRWCACRGAKGGHVSSLTTPKFVR